MNAVLGIDTATDACSVGLANSEGRREAHRILPRAHNRHVLAMVDEVLGGSSLTAIDAFCCGVGPGSFTGLRIAVSVVQGIAWATDKPVYAVCSLWAQAQDVTLQQAAGAQHLLSITDAQIGQVYYRWFEWGEAAGCWSPAAPAGIASPSALVLTAPSDIAVAGSGCALIDQFPEALRLAAGYRLFPDARPHASVMADFVRQNRVDCEPIAPNDLAPQYVQQDIGWKKLSEQPRGD